VRWVWNEGERQVVDAADVDGIAASVDLDPPVERVRMVWAIGLNYRDHAAETGAPIPTEPVVFVKSTGSIVGHGADILIPPHVTQPDYEGELAVVIGRRARDVPADEAMDVVEGVTCAHDVSARDHQFTTGQWVWSKSFDTFCPLGPALVSPDELDLGHLDIERYHVWLQVLDFDQCVQPIDGHTGHLHVRLGSDRLAHHAAHKRRIVHYQNTDGHADISVNCACRKVTTRPTTSATWRVFDRVGTA